MKKLLFFGLLSLSIITGCKTQIYSIGTSEAEFRAHNKGADLIEQTEHTTVYKKYDRAIIPTTGDKYYYFADGKLVRIDETGPNRADIVIQHTRK
jgi:hypothetical protein